MGSNRKNGPIQKIFNSVPSWALAQAHQYTKKQTDGQKGNLIETNLISGSE